MRHHSLLIVLLSIALAPASIRAQHSGFGIKGGMLLADTRSGKASTNLIPGATAGGYFALRAGPRMEVQPEVLITAMGAGYTLADGARSTLRTLYVQVPVSAKLYIGNVMNAQVGCQMGRLLLAQQNVDGEKTDLTAEYNAWDYGFILGIGADLVSGLDLGLRYYNGMRPILMNDETLFPRNRAFMLTAGYRLGRLGAVKFKRNRR